MATYRHIHTTFWNDPFIIELTPEEKGFYLYLMTNPHTNQCGCYEIPLRTIEFETGYNRETVNKLINRFEQYGKIRYDTTTHELFIVNWHKYNFSRSPQVVAHIHKELEKIKNSDFRRQVSQFLLDSKTDTVSIQYRCPIDTELQEKEKEKEKEKINTLQAASAGLIEIPSPIFNMGVDLLVRAGKKESTARTFLGKLIKNYGKAAVEHAVLETQKQNAVNPCAYMQDFLSKSGKAENIFAGGIG